jgi:coproporphyrinogen III oxidase
LADRAAAHFRALQDRIVAGLEAVDGGGRFGADAWRRAGGGGGVTRVLADGGLFEKAGVAWSDVFGELPPELAALGPGDGRTFRATGVSLVLHPRSPRVPAVHANFRYVEKGDARWFGGGADLTPCYLRVEDVVHFHRAWKDVCDRHVVADHARFKAWCDEYFFLPHRGEARGAGGIFFDDLGRNAPDDGLEEVFAFVRDAGDTFLPAYVPIATRRKDEPWGEREREWQLFRRGRYVEFNLLHDRGTIFGLRTGGRTESILMSLPPLVRWVYDRAVDAGSPEAEMLDALRPRDWLAP